MVLGLLVGGPLQDISDMGDAKLLKTVERWLRTERDSTRAAETNGKASSNGNVDSHAVESPKPSAAPSFPSRHMAYFS